MHTNTSKICSKNKIRFFTTPWGLAVLAVLVVLCTFCSLRYGSSEMSIAEFISALTKKQGVETQSIILYSVRLPRTLAGLLAGAGLSVSGALLQSVTDNALAGPNIIGVNAGAGFAAVIFLCLAPQYAQFLPFAAFAGAFAASILILLLAGMTGISKTSVILAGVVLTALLNSLISFLTLTDTDILASYNSFSVGGLYGVKADGLIIPAVIIAVSFIVSMLFAKRTDILCLGDGCAVSLGVNVRATRIICLLCASASAGAAVSFAGLLGFVGLIVPHIARKLTGNLMRNLLPVSALIGAGITVLADLLGRLIAAPSEIPVGIMMSFIGCPFFIAILLKHRSEG